MKLRIIQADLLDRVADAVTLTIDGLIEQRSVNVDRQLGSTGHQFMRRFPDADLVGTISAQVRFPIPLGHTVLVDLAEGRSSFRRVLLMSTLPHVAELREATYRNAVRSAFTSALELAHGAGASSVATGILAGGWRLQPWVAWATMVDVLRARQRAVHFELIVCVKEGLEDVTRLAVQAGLAVQPSSGCAGVETPQRES